MNVPAATCEASGGYPTVPKPDTPEEDYRYGDYEGGGDLGYGYDGEVGGGEWELPESSEG